MTLLASRLGIDPLQLSGSSGEVIDEQAREDYRGRYLMLLDDMRLAEANHDRATMERIQLEQDARCPNCRLHLARTVAGE